MISLVQFDLQRPLWLGALLLVALVALWARRSMVRWPPGQRAAASWVRGLAVACLLLAAADPHWVRLVPQRRLAVAIDHSQSIAPAERAQADAQLAVFERARQRGECRVAYVAFAGRAARWPLEARLADLRRDQTNLETVVELAGRLDRADGWEMVLLSDGNPTDGDVRRAAASCGIPVSVIPLAGVPEDEVYVAGLDAPSAARPGTPLAVEVELWSHRAASGTVRLRAGHAIVAEQAVKLEAGSNRVGLTAALAQGTPAGWVALRAEIAASRDTHRNNNFAAAWLYVDPPPKALLVWAEAASRRVEDALGAAGWSLGRSSPEQVPESSGSLAAYDLVVLANVPAARLRGEQVAAVEAFVRGGGGLLATGGERSFYPGGYAGTRLEGLLPLRATARRQPPRADLALVLVIDRSQSMEGERIELAREAARQVIDLLPAGAQFGLLAFEDQSDWLVPLGPAADRKVLEGHVARLKAEGRTNLYPALLKALLALHEVPALRRHLILVTDGVSHMGDFTDLARQMSAAGMTLSTVSVGRQTADTVLEEMARTAGGQHYRCDNPRALPQIFRYEAAGAAGLGVREGEFAVQRVAGADGLAWLADRAAPPIAGYDEAILRPEAAAWLQVESGDPLAAAWSVGRGRAIALATDIDGDWTASWRSWERASRLWVELAAAAGRATVRPPVPDEELPRFPAELRVQPTGEPLLRWLAATTGGEYGVSAEEVLSRAPPPVRVAVPGWRLLAALAAVLLLADVLLRRVAWRPPPPPRPPATSADAW